MQTPTTRFCCSLLLICYFNIKYMGVFACNCVCTPLTYSSHGSQKRVFESLGLIWLWAAMLVLKTEAWSPGRGRSTCMGNTTRAWQRSQHKWSRTFPESRGKQAVATFGDHDEELPLPPLDQGCTHHKSDFTQNMDVSMWFVRNVLPCLRLKFHRRVCWQLHCDFNLWCVS